MKGNRGLSALAGLLIGIVLGGWIYYIPAATLISGPYSMEEISQCSTRLNAIFRPGYFYFGILPGALIGLIAGLTAPFHLPRGHMSKSIGAMAWIPVTALAWITQGYNLTNMSASRIVLAIFVTSVSFAILFPWCELVGSFLEKIREKG